MEDVILVNNATLCMNVTQHDAVVWRGTMQKELLLSRANDEYYSTVPQCETLHSRTLCWFAYFAASHVRQSSVFLPPIEYRINIEVES